MSTPLQFTLTDAGSSALWNANNDGVSLDITHIQFGSGNRIPVGDELSLLTPQQTVEISEGARISSTQIRMSGTFSGDLSYEIREIGIWSGAPDGQDSVLFAYWSTASDLLASKHPGVDFVFNYDMVVSDALPGDSINIVISGNQSSLLLLIDDHEAKQDPHPQYITQADLAAALLTGRAKRFFHATA